MRLPIRLFMVSSNRGTITYTVCEIISGVDVENRHFTPLYSDCRPPHQSINQSIIKTNLHTEVTSGLQKKNAKVTKTTETIKLKIKKLKSLAKQKSFQVTFKSFCVRNLLQRRWQSVPCSWCGVGKGPLTEFQSRTWLFIS